MVARLRFPLLASASQWLAERFELTRGDPGHNVRSMEGLRGFAVFLVFLVHYVTLIDPWIDRGSSLVSFAQALHTIGNAGVDLFFVLSGYLIYGSLISRYQPFLRFMSRRAERIYPAFIAVFVLYVVIATTAPVEGKLPAESVARTIFLIENLLLLPGLFPIEPLITVAWSLSYEMFFYLTIPLLVGVIGLRRRAFAWRCAFFAIVAIAVVVYCAIYGGPVRLIMFVAGILLYDLIASGRVKPPRGWLGAAALVGGLLATLLPFSGSSGFALKIFILGVTFPIVCFACFARPYAAFSRFFTWTPLRWLGNMSYSYYLLHGLTLRGAFAAFAALAPVTPHGWAFFAAWMPLMFALSLVPTSALFVLIERPMSLTPRRRQVLPGETPTQSLVNHNATKVDAP